MSSFFFTGKKRGVADKRLNLGTYSIILAYRSIYSADTNLGFRVEGACALFSQGRDL